MSPWIPRIGGFLLYPVAGALATRLASSTADTVSMRMTKSAVCHAAAGAAAWYAAGKTKGATRSFLRGGMWGEALSTATVVAIAPADVAVTTAAGLTSLPHTGTAARLSAFLQTADTKRLMGT